MCLGFFIRQSKACSPSLKTNNAFHAFLRMSPTWQTKNRKVQKTNRGPEARGPVVLLMRHEGVFWYKTKTSGPRVLGNYSSKLRKYWFHDGKNEQAERWTDMTWP